MAERERRCWRPREELRFVPAARGRPARLQGLAVPYNRLSQDLGGFKETVHRGAFSESIASGRDMRADVEHDRSKLLGRTSASTLVFAEKPAGLFATIILPRTQLGRDTAEEVKSGLRDALSVSWESRGVQDRFSEENGVTVRHIEKANLTGVAVTAFPAYRQTAGELALRSLAEWEESQHRSRATWRLRLAIEEALLDEPSHWHKENRRLRLMLDEVAP